jgi:hypothetical protein
MSVGVPASAGARQPKLDKLQSPKSLGFIVHSHPLAIVPGNDLTAPAASLIIFFVTFISNCAALARFFS